MALGTPYSLGTAAYAGNNIPSVQITPVQVETQAKLTTTTAVAAGSLIVVAVGFDIAQPTVVVTDSASNVYAASPDVAAQNASGLVAQLWSCANAKALPAGSSIFVSLPGAPADSASGIVPAAVAAPNYLCVAAAAVTGVMPLSALDATSTQSGSGTSPSSGTALNGMANETFFGVIGWLRTASPGSVESLTWGNSFNALADAEAQNGSSGRAGIFLGYRNVTGVGNEAATGALGNADQWTALVACYRQETEAARGVVYVNGAPLPEGRVGYTPSVSTNRIEVRGLSDLDGQLLTDANAQPTIQVNDANGSSVQNQTSMDYAGPGWWTEDVQDFVWVHGAGPWACTMEILNQAQSKKLVTYRFTTQDPQN